MQERGGRFWLSNMWQAIVAAAEMDRDEVVGDDIDTVLRSPARTRVLLLVEGARFNLFIGLVILANAVTTALEVDSNDVASSPPGVVVLDARTVVSREALDILEFMFLTVYVVEVGLRLFALRFQFFSRALHWLDLVTIVVPLVVRIVEAGDGGQDSGQRSSSGAAGFAGNLTLLRMLRLSRLGRLLRLISMFKELRVLVEGLRKSVGTICWVILLIFIACFIVATILTELIGKNDEAFLGPNSRVPQEFPDFDHRISFGSIPRSMISLTFIFLVDGWSDLVLPVTTVMGYMFVTFTLFTFLTTFGLLNIIVGMVVEHTLEAFELMNKIVATHECAYDGHDTGAFGALAELFVLADADQDGLVSEPDLRKVLEDEEVGPSACRLLTKAGLPAHAAEELLGILAQARGCEADEKITFDELQGLVRGCNGGAASSRDTLATLFAVRLVHRQLQRMASAAGGAPPSLPDTAFPSAITGPSLPSVISFGGLNRVCESEEEYAALSSASSRGGAAGRESSSALTQSGRGTSSAETAETAAASLPGAAALGEAEQEGCSERRLEAIEAKLAEGLEATRSLDQKVTHLTRLMEQLMEKGRSPDGTGEVRRNAGEMVCAASSID